jgi:hypothetical protein
MVLAGVGAVEGLVWEYLIIHLMVETAVVYTSMAQAQAELIKAELVIITLEHREVRPEHKYHQ